MSITKEDLLKGRNVLYPEEYTLEISNNLNDLLYLLQKVEGRCPHKLQITSGWRPSKINDATSNAAKASNHTKGLAVDIFDPNGDIMRWVLENLEEMAALGFYFEDFRWTPNWLHAQIVPPKSKKRIYIPSLNPASAPDKWDGKYDTSLDG